MADYAKEDKAITKMHSTTFEAMKNMYEQAKVSTGPAAKLARGLAVEGAKLTTAGAEAVMKTTKSLIAKSSGKVPMGSGGGFFDFGKIGTRKDRMTHY